MSLVVFHKNARANITLNYMYSLKNQNGIVAVSGTYIEDNKLKGRIRRDVAYNWTENQDSYHLHSSRINKFEIIETLPDDLLADILPDFYVYPDKDVSYSILNQGVHGFLFTIGKRPPALLRPINGRKPSALCSTGLTRFKETYSLRVNSL